MPQHVRKGDLVTVISGADRGRSGRILRVKPKDGKVVVEGMNVHTKHVKPSPKNQQGGIIQKEMPMAISNVLPSVNGKPTRVRFERRPDGAKVRLAVKGGQMIGSELKKGRK
ncbi:MAG: 50S ribosomal protein L24 [Phycisphaeraceae bacterium]